MIMGELPILFTLVVTTYAQSNDSDRPGWLNYDSSCPPSEELKACFCGREHRSQEDVYYSTIACYNQHVQEINEAFKILNGTESMKIILDGINLEATPTNFFEGIRFQRVEIFACNMNRLAGSEDLPHLVGLEESLKDLKMWYNNNLTKLKIGHLRQLKRLSLGENAIKELGDDSFGTETSSIERIYIDKNGIEKLGDHAFANLANLKWLYIVNNGFGTIKRSMFPANASRLNTLVLNDDNIENIPKDLFTGMPALQFLHLQNNKIAKLENDTWRTIWKQLDTIDLSGNPLMCDSHMHWMFEMHGPPGMMGTCAGPDEHRGRKLINFINAKGRTFTLFDT